MKKNNVVIIKAPTGCKSIDKEFKKKQTKKNH